MQSKDKAIDALDFGERKNPILAFLARKYLSVQASSCAVEHMFSIAGHIFQLNVVA